MLTEIMRLLTICAIIICLSILTGCYSSVPKKRSWSKMDGSAHVLAKKIKSRKRVWIKTGGTRQIASRPPGPKKIIRFGTEPKEEIASKEPVKRPDISSDTTEPEILLSQELQALNSTHDWDDHQTGVIQEVEIEDIPEDQVVYDFPITINRQVEVYLELFQGEHRKYFSEWLARSGRYISMMQAELEAGDLPLDLVYLAMIESGFNQTATSKAKAVGLWQFMSYTGRDYGLEITEYVDERRDDIKSTRAAVAFLSDLYDEFGDWFLAVAAYNGGPGRMRNAIKKSKSRDFWKIAQEDFLPLETKRYVPKLIAAIIIAKEPEEYGFTDIEINRPVSYDTIAVGPGLTFDTVASVTNSSGTIIQNLNQELLQKKTPLDREKYTLRIPKGTRRMAERNLSRFYAALVPEKSIIVADSKKYQTSSNRAIKD